MKQSLGIYAHDYDKNFDQFLDAYELPYLIRKLAILVKPTVEVTYDDEIDEFDIVVNFFYFNFHTKFIIGQEVEDKLPFTGEVVKKIVTKTDDGKFLSKQLTGKHAGTIMITEVNDDMCICHLEYKNVKAIRAYKKKKVN